MGGVRRLLSGGAALAAGVASAAAVAAGQTGEEPGITISGEPQAVERSRGQTLTINGTSFRSGHTITIRGLAPREGAAAAPGEDFDASAQVVTLQGEDSSAVVTVGIADDETDEPAERFDVEASQDGVALARHPATIEDDDGTLDAALCGGMLQPLVRLLDPPAAIGRVFGGCSPE